MNEIKILFNKYWFSVTIILVLCGAAFLRFYNFENRWGLAYDQAHDALVARYALKEHKIPLLGPFSSAGAFQSGGEWYWFIMLATAVYPYSVLTPWIMLTILYIFFVLLIILLGKELLDKRFGIIAGILAAVSTSQIAQSVNLTNQSPLAFIALLSLWSMIRYVRKREDTYLFFLGLTISLASSIHLQGLGLITLLFFTLIFCGIPSRKGVLLTIVGLLLPWVPIFISDAGNNFLNTRNMIMYYLRDQYKVSLDVLGRRWLTYAGVFWPNAWAHIIGGTKILAYFVLASLSFVVIFKGVKRRLTKEWYIFLVSFLGAIILLRYTRTPLFDSYLVFLHPFVLFLTAWLVFYFYKKNIVIGLLFLSILVVGSMQKDIKEIQGGINYSALKAKEWKSLLSQTLPGKKFSLYDYRYRSLNFSFSLALFLENEGMLSDVGYKIGFGNPEETEEKVFHPQIEKGEAGIVIRDLNSSSSAELKKARWSFINPSEIYRSTEEWYK